MRFIHKFYSRILFRSVWSMTLARTSRRLLMAVAVAWLGVFLSSQPSFASCGDWLDSSGDQMADHGASRSTENGTGTDSPQAPRPPCNGPSCRGNQDLPIVPAPVPQVPTHRDYAALNRIADWDSARVPQVWGSERDAVALAGYPLGIEHRPRI